MYMYYVMCTVIYSSSTCTRLRKKTNTKLTEKMIVLTFTFILIVLSSIVHLWLSIIHRPSFVFPCHFSLFPPPSSPPPCRFNLPFESFDLPSMHTFLQFLSCTSVFDSTYPSVQSAPSISPSSVLNESRLVSSVCFVPACV